MPENGMACALPGHEMVIEASNQTELGSHQDRRRARCRGMTVTPSSVHWFNHSFFQLVSSRNEQAWLIVTSRTRSAIG